MSFDEKRLKYFQLKGMNKEVEENVLVGAEEEEPEFDFEFSLREGENGFRYMKWFLGPQEGRGIWGWARRREDPDDEAGGDLSEVVRRILGIRIFSGAAGE